MTTAIPIAVAVAAAIALLAMLVPRRTEVRASLFAPAAALAALPAIVGVLPVTAWTLMNAFGNMALSGTGGREVIFGALAEAVRGAFVGVAASAVLMLLTALLTAGGWGRGSDDATAAPAAWRGLVQVALLAAVVLGLGTGSVFMDRTVEIVEVVIRPAETPAERAQMDADMKRLIPELDGQPGAAGMALISDKLSRRLIGMLLFGITAALAFAAGAVIAGLIAKPLSSSPGWRRAGPVVLAALGLALTAQAAWLHSRLGRFEQESVRPPAAAKPA